MHRRKTARIVRTALRVYPPSPAAAQGPRTAAGSCPRFQQARSSQVAAWSRIDPRQDGSAR